MSMRYYHNYCDSNEMEFRMFDFDDPEVIFTDKWVGPFRTFSEAKKSALNFARSDLRIAKDKLKHIQSLKKWSIP